MFGLTPGPWRWRRFRVEGANNYTCVLESVRPIADCPHYDRMVIYMRDDLAQFPYAGKLPNQRVLERSYEMLTVLRAIKARLEGRWDDPAFLELGPHHTDDRTDMLRLVDGVLNNLKG